MSLNTKSIILNFDTTKVNKLIEKKSSSSEDEKSQQKKYNVEPEKKYVEKTFFLVML